MAAFWLSVLAVVTGAVLSVVLAPADEPIINRPLEVSDGGYVTSRTCQTCHPGQYASWHASYHRTMTQVATPASVVAPFNGDTLSVYGETYRVERRGDEHWVIQEGRGKDGAGQRERRIVMTTGSHHFQAYWLETGARRQISLFPFAYRISERAWMPFDTIFLSPPEPGYGTSANSTGLWNAVCAECHSTSHRPRLQRPGGMDTYVSEFGIACEACHGPAEEHVRLNRNPTRRYGLYQTDDGDPSIVHPARLSHQRSAEICGQCHSVHSRVGETRTVELGVKDYLDHESLYRPGEVLADHKILVTEDGPQTLYSDVVTHFWSDGTVRVNGREYNSLLRSPCFQRGEMSCISCHAMHQADDDTRPRKVWADDQLKPEMDGSAACLSCHRGFRDEAKVAAHTHHATTSAGSDCLNCHMPYTAWGLQKATRSHEIASPTVAESVDIGRPNACNLCHLDRTLAWTAEHLETWYGIESPPLDGNHRSISAAVLWILTGDAAQRALVTWNMGWESARKASGEGWIAPYLGMQFLDYYPTTRFTALRSLRQIDGFRDFDTDPMASDEQRADAVDRLLLTFDQRRDARGHPRAAAVLMEPSGAWQKDVARALLPERNTRRVRLME